MAQRRVEAVERALTLLEAFSPQRSAMTLTELSQATGFYKSTILRLMASLEHYGYAVRDDRGVYHVGPAIARLAPLAVESDSLERLIRPTLTTLRDATGETAAFYIRDGKQRRCALVEIGQREVRHHLEEGAVSALERDVVSRALCDEGAPGEVFIEWDVACAGLCVLAVAVHGPEGRVMGALALSGATPRFVDEPDGELTAALRARLAALVASWPKRASALGTPDSELFNATRAPGVCPES
ncbi:IclR family transcriptional regulator [Salinicola rhizosphaerae]|uniref:Transcriptional regulator n=1 Tax=Salinicola rhizosphaerae TaxID=1443141 RepID=A0ABQ3DWD2_9GAMM|nr:helix-turn-helix domain-containing protein [Salinicola rhizosphaerae]GHB17433.1 transcriptional regulator [Salinicola rhizosphaerae]